VIQTKSAFAPAAKSDGYRMIVVNQWPNGLAKGKGAGAEWVKQLGPSEGLRKWMTKNPRKVNTFVDKYLAELGKNDAGIAKVNAMHERFGAVTVLSVPDFDDVWPIASTLTQFLNAACDID
jgi:uncharacterized protein YeaO (DUF488 family)